ncbi:MAG TPA: PP2C family protein-serine/threonine phosphatase [Planctomycetota bacterium]|nr:PP2C family protein-serine/threonine phosphatase [Planctomycetota bacterium]
MMVDQPAPLQGDSPRQTVAMLRRALRETPDIWAQHDSRNRWFCPHCGEIINTIIVPPERGQALLHDLPFQIQEHLKVCAAALSGLPPQKRQRGADAALSGLRQALHEARLQQRHMLHDAPRFDGLDIACIYQPKMGIGGDFYGFVELPGRRLGVAIGDASGHGVEACMVMAVTKKLCMMFARNGKTPRECLSAVNAELHADVMQGVFATGSYGIFDLAEKTLSYVRAGHPPALIYNPARKPDILELDSNGLAMGVDAGRRFDKVLEERTITIQSGDLILFYTDGLIELPGLPPDDLGEPWFGSVLRKNYSRKVDDINSQVWYSAEKMFEEGRQADDISLVTIKVQ